MLKEHMDKLHLVAKALMVHEKLDNKEFEEIMRGEYSPEKIESEYEQYLKNTEQKLDVTVSADANLDESKEEPKPEENAPEAKPAENGENTEKTENSDDTNKE